MNNASDAELTELIVATTGSAVSDDSPNVVGGVAGATFDLLLEGEAGRVIGSSGATYRLNITAFDETAGVAVPGLSPTGNPFSETFNAAGGWVASGGDFIKQKTFNITIPAAVTRGNIFHYTASLVAGNFEVVTIIRSDSFVLG